VTAEQLLYTDREGEPASLEEVISDGLEGGYEDRLPGLRELCVSGSAEACQVLVAWSDPVGLAELARWTRDRPEVDFRPLVDAIRTGKYTAETETAHAGRVDAVRALLAIADREPIGEDLNDAIPGDDAFIAAVADALRDAIERSLERRSAPFDLLAEAAALVVPLARVDDEASATFAERLRKREKRNRRMLSNLVTAMGQGRGPRTLAVLEDLRRDKRVREQADAVFAHRTRD
jgi:hypothetical protein